MRSTDSYSIAFSCSRHSAANCWWEQKAGMLGWGECRTHQLCHPEGCFTQDSNFRIIRIGQGLGVKSKMKQVRSWLTDAQSKTWVWPGNLSIRIRFQKWVSCLGGSVLLRRGGGTLPPFSAVLNYWSQGAPVFRLGHSGPRASCPWRQGEGELLCAHIIKLKINMKIGSSEVLGICSLPFLLFIKTIPVASWNP